MNLTDPYIRQCSFRKHTKNWSYNTGEGDRHSVEKFRVMWLQNLQAAYEVWNLLFCLLVGDIKRDSKNRWASFQIYNYQIIHVLKKSSWFSTIQRINMEKCVKITSVILPSLHREWRASICRASRLFLSFCKSLKHDTRSCALSPLPTLNKQGFL